MNRSQGLRVREKWVARLMADEKQRWLTGERREADRQGKRERKLMPHQYEHVNSGFH